MVGQEEDGGIRKPDRHTDGSTVTLKAVDVATIAMFLAGRGESENLVLPLELADLTVTVPSATINAVKDFVFERPELRDTAFGRKILYSNRNRDLVPTEGSCGFDSGG